MGKKANKKGGGAESGAVENPDAYWAQENQRTTWAETEDQQDNIPQADERTNEPVFDLNSAADFGAQYVGILQGIQRTPNDLIEQIDQAKKMGNVAWRPSTNDGVIITLSQYGIKVTDVKRQQVFVRAPVNRIGNVVNYIDMGNNMIVVETGHESEPFDFKYYIYQVKSEADAKQFCETFKRAFDAIYAKATLENL